MNNYIRQLDEQLMALRTVFDVMQQPVFFVNERNQRVVDANPAGCEALGIARGELIGCSWSTIARRLPTASLRNVDGARQSVAVVDEHVFQRAERRGTSRDALTGLPNRDALSDRISSDNDGRLASRIALLFIDLNGFKQVNDSWGHIVGDCVLRAIGARLGESVRPRDLIVRYGGDEFLVVVEAVSRRRDLDRLARRITRAVERPILVEGQEIMLTASIGIAQRKSRAASIDALIAEADSAMYRVKSQSRRAAAAISAS